MQKRTSHEKTTQLMQSSHFIILKENVNCYKVFKTVNEIIPKHSKVLAYTSMVFNPQFGDYDISASYNAQIMDVGVAMHHKANEAYPEWYTTKFCLQNHFDYLVVTQWISENIYRLDHINTFQRIASIPHRYRIYKVKSAERVPSPGRSSP